MLAPIKHKTGIKKRLAWFIVALWLVVLVVGLGLGYLGGYKIIRNSIIQHHIEMARMIGTSLDRILNEEEQDLEVYLSHSGRKEVVKEHNLKYKNMTQEEISNYFKDMDKEWANLSVDDPLLKEYLNNKDSLRLKEIAEVDEGVAEIFVTDRYGGLVLASGKTSDFYQADEDWWQVAFNNGKGQVYISDIELDQSTNAISISFAIPLKDETGEVIGVGKGVLDIDRILAPLKIFNIGKTGHAVLVNKDGYIIFHENIQPLSSKYFTDKELQQLHDSENQWLLIKDQQSHGKDMMVACAPVSYGLFSKYGVYWTICISQEAKEVFLPLQVLFLQLALLSIFLVIIIISISNIFASIFVKPIRILHEATEKIAEGDLDYPINIRTEDEIEQLADSFRYMISVLKEKQDNLRELTNSLEAKVKERTSELTKTQEATLNILEDLTEAKRKIEESMRIKSEFTSMVSHELRTPLTAIKEGIGIVLDGSAGQINVDQKDFLETAKRNVDRLARLINDVLDFQKLESGRMPFNFQEGDLNAVIKESYASMKPQADSKNIRFEINLAENLPRMNFDKDKIAQVMVNLINNAIKFTITGGIKVSTILGSNTVKVAVEDTGPGIKKEDMPKLFQRFQQLGEYHERRVASSGLGLAISKEIIEMHKGKIWVESEYGKGSTFYFVLPIKERRE